MNNKYVNIRSEQDMEELARNMRKKIETTMIGALSSIEEHLGFLWKDDAGMIEVYQKLRSEILDKGNKQIRYIDVDLSNYNVTKKPKKTIPINKE